MLCSVTHNAPAYLSTKMGPSQRGDAPELDKNLSSATILPVHQPECSTLFSNYFLFFISLFHLIKKNSTLLNFVSPQTSTMPLSQYSSNKFIHSLNASHSANTVNREMSQPWSPSYKFLTSLQCTSLLNILSSDKPTKRKRTCSHR